MAMRCATRLYSCYLASAGVEGPVRAYTGELGFLKLIGAGRDTVERLREGLHVDQPLRGIGRTMFKRWPVGSRGQSAIRAALEARAHVSDIAAIKAVRVTTDAEAYEHLVAIRTNPWSPHSRETADHSMPYIVAAAVIEGSIRPSSFAQSTVNDPTRSAFLAERVTVERATSLSLGAASGYLTRVEIEMMDGHVFAGDAKPAPGHQLSPFSDHDVEEKLFENVEPILGSAQVGRIAAALWSIDSLDDVRTLTALFRADGLNVDDEIVE